MNEMRNGTSKLRVLHVVGGLNVGGTETWLTQGLKVIDRARYQFDFLIFDDRPQFYRASVESLGSRVFICPPPAHFWSFARKFMRLLRCGQYHAVHAHVFSSSGLVLALAARAGVPCRIFHSHTAQDDSRRGWLRSWYFKFSRGMIQRNASRGVAVSQEAATPFFPPDWQQHPERWKISPVGIDLHAFAHESEREAVRRELDIPIDSPAVVHVGRFLPVKNHKFLIAIVREMVISNPSVVFVLVGDGPERAHIMELAERLGVRRSVRFLGLRPDVPRILQACDAFIMPSFYEGFPLAYVEAQAAGLACVVSSAITRTAEFHSARTWRLATSEPALNWARALQEAIVRKRLPQVPAELCEVSVERSMQRLLECYQ